jgi:hypothetical protein
MVLKVDDPVSMDIHLLAGDVEQHMGVVPPMLGVTKMTVNILKLFGTTLFLPLQHGISGDFLTCCSKAHQVRYNISFQLSVLYNKMKSHFYYF